MGVDFLSFQSLAWSWAFCFYRLQNECRGKEFLQPVYDLTYCIGVYLDHGG
jgi:hypothetical protein